VFVGTTYSNEKFLTAGVHQDSFLGLFSFFNVNNIADALTSVTRLFADDSSLEISSQHKSYIESTINADLKIIKI
jgi:hypothetical protein